MFGLGIIELAIILVLGYVAFRHWIARRFPGAVRAVRFVLITTAVLLLVFGIITRYGS